MEERLECGHAEFSFFCLQGYAHPVHRRERERERGREREREFLFLKGMTGALAPFSYLVYYYCAIIYVNKNKLYKISVKSVTLFHQP